MYPPRVPSVPSDVLGRPCGKFLQSAAVSLLACGWRVLVGPHTDIHDHVHRCGETAPTAAKPLAVTVEHSRTPIAGLDVVQRSTGGTAQHERANRRIAEETVDEVLVVSVVVDPLD